MIMMVKTINTSNNSIQVWNRYRTYHTYRITTFVMIFYSLLSLLLLYNLPTINCNNNNNNYDDDDDDNDDTATTTTTTIQSNDHIESSSLLKRRNNYGIDVSWPMQCYDTIFGNTDNDDDNNNNNILLESHNHQYPYYQQYMNGCYEMYSTNICNTYEKLRIQYNINISKQHVHQNYTTIGFEKYIIPNSIYTILYNFWYQYSTSYLQYEFNNNNMLLMNDDHNDIDMNLYNYYINNHWLSPTKVLPLFHPNPYKSTSKSTSSSLTIQPSISYQQQQYIIEQVQVIVEQWTNTSVQFIHMYNGIRTYTNQTIIIPHIKNNPYVITVIMNIAQQLQEVHDNNNDWIIELIGHDQYSYNITLQPQEMLIYESHSIIYSQPYPLYGQYYANCYLYFEPINNYNNNDHNNDDNHNEKRYYKTSQEKFNAALAKQQLQQQHSQHSQTSSTTSNSLSIESIHQDDSNKNENTNIIYNNKQIKLPYYIQDGTIDAKRWKQEFNFHRVPLMNTNDINDMIDSTLDDIFPLIIQHQSTTSKSSSNSNNNNNKKTPGATSAHILAARDDIVRLRELMKTDPKLLDQPDDNGWLPIHEAARAGSTKVVRFLIEEYGISDKINARTNNGKGGTPLWWAENKLSKNHEVIKILKQNGAVSIPPYLNKKMDMSNHKKKE